VWENDCSGMVIRVLVASVFACPPISDVTWTLVEGAEAANWELATENRLPLRDACFCNTRWMLGLLVACWSCWESMPCRNAFTTRIWVWSRVRPRIHKIWPERELENDSWWWWWWWWWWPTSLPDKLMGEVGSGGGSRPYDSDFGMQLFGMVVIICCQTSVPRPKKMHQIHCSKLRGEVENANPPNWMITICKEIKSKFQSFSVCISFENQILGQWRWRSRWRNK